MKNEKYIVFPESRYINSNPVYMLIKTEYTVILETFNNSLSQFNNFLCLQFLFTSRTFIATIFYYIH